MSHRIEEIARHIRQSELAQHSKKMVFVSGNFNIIHPGHLRLLQFAAECGDFLIVGVNSDVSAGVALPAHLRLEAVKAISLVKYAFLLEDTAESFINALCPAVVVKGKEHENHFNSEQKVVDSYGGKLLFSSGEVKFSSLDLLRKEFHETNLSSIVKPLDFPKLHGFTFSDLKKTLFKLKGLRVVVIGDLIVDEYITCEALGMSQEDPTIVVQPLFQEKFIGGSAIVAAHARGLGGSVRYFSVIGKDETAQFAKDKLLEYGVKTSLFEDESRPTTLKQRYRAGNKTLLRISHLRQHEITREVSNQLFESIKPALDHADLLLFSDFNYGCLSQPLVDQITTYCLKKNVMMVADSQSSSQVGNVARFENMTLLTPTEREARLAVRDFSSGLVVLAESLRKNAQGKNIIITLGAEGLLIHSEILHKNEWMTDRLPAMNSTPKDSSGAGDSLLTCCAMSLAVGADIWQSTYLGALAAACQVGRVGNIPLSTREIESEIES